MSSLQWRQVNSHEIFDFLKAGSILNSRKTHKLPPNPILMEAAKLIKNNHNIPQITVFGDNRYVLKRFDKVDAQHPFNMRGFVNEIGMGALMKSPIGVVSYGFIVKKQKGKVNGYIVMDHASFGDPSVTTVSLREYLKDYKARLSKSALEQLDKRIKSTMFAFYKITGHMHGDLHFDNIMVNVLKQNPGSVQTIVIIDYGNVVRIPTHINTIQESNRIENVFGGFKKWEELQRTLRPNSTQRVNLYGGTFDVLWNRNLPFRHNKNMYNRMWGMNHRQ